jgi:trimethylamine---corrinoid protein Co-methyltransferase
VVDDDIYGRLFRLHEGIAVDEERLAAELIRTVGPNRHYLEEPHTVRHMRREFRLSSLAVRQTPEGWTQQGCRDAGAIAHERVEAILKKSPEPRLDAERVAELDAMAAAAQNEAAHWAV